MMRTFGSRKLEDRKTIHAHPYTSHMVAELGCSSASVGLETPTDLKGFDMMTAVRELAEQEHSAALAQLRSRISPITKSGADDGNDTFVKVQDLITDLIRWQTEASPETNQKSSCDEETSKATEKEDRDLLSVAYKNPVDSRRAAWRVITSVEQKEKSQGEEQLASYAREYIAKVENELQKIRDGIFALIDKKLVPSAGIDETKVSYYRMKSDYYRYLAEFATGETKGKADEDALDACVEANQIAEKDLVVSHPVRLATALDFSAFRSEVFQNPDEASQMACVAFEDASTSPVDQIAQKTIEIPRLRRIGNVIDIPVVQVEHVPQPHVAEKTFEITQLDVVEKIVETPEIITGHGIQDRIQQRTVAQIVDVPVQQFAEEQAQAFKVFSQNRVQQSFRGQTAETPDISLAEKTVEMPDTRTQDKTQRVVNTHGQHVVNTVEAEKPFINETINQMIKHIEIPQLQIVEKTVEAAKHNSTGACQGTQVQV